MAILGIAQIGMGLAGMSAQSKAAKQQAAMAQEQARKEAEAAEGQAQQYDASAESKELQEQIMAENQAIAMWRARDALERGLKTNVAIREDARALMGTQRAQQAASGLAVGTGTFKAMLDDTMRGAMKDIQVATESTQRESYEHRLDAYSINRNRQLTRMSIASDRRAAKRVRETKVPILQAGNTQAAAISSAGRAQTFGTLANLAGQTYDMFKPGGVFNSAPATTQQYAPMHRPGFGV